MIRILYLSTNSGLRIRIYPARHIKPLLDETPYFSKTDTNLMSYAQPCKLQSVNISVATLNSFAIMSPSASELFEITTVASTPFKLVSLYGQ